MTTRFPERLKTVPDIPKEFGDDGGHFYRYYDELADEIDEDLVKSLKAQLDGILIFAGLFAGVNSAFLALTLPQMSADPADDTNALLLQIALGGNTANITSAADLPSASFTPPPGIYPINVLFSVSLTLALLSSFMAVLGQQWIVHYRKRSGGGPEHQRWEQFRRYLGAKRWRLELVLDDLVPGMLQLGLGIFCIAFALYLGTLNQSLNRIVVWLLYAAAATIFAMSTFVAFDPWCPFKLPWSRIVRPMVSGAATAVVWLGMCIVGVVPLFILNIIGCFWQAIAHFHRPNVQWEISATENLRKTVALCIKALPTLYQGFVLTGIRSPDDADDLKIKALRRMMCTSEDRSALVYAAINLQVIRDQGALASLVNDEEFYTRLSGLHQATLRETQQGRTHSHRSFMESRVFSTSFFHLLITTGAVPHITWIDEDMYGEYGAAIIALDRLRISPHQMDEPNQGAVTPLCSHCASLLFCRKLLILQSKGTQ